jgi:condensin complex subunit 2
MELEFAVDPLFKKASADFDEGGAKGLLLNHLSIDSEGRIVFDSSDDAGDAAPNGERSNTKQTEDGDDELSTPAKEISEVQPTKNSDAEVDIDTLASKFFPDLSILDSQDICPSMKSFALGDPNSDLNIPFLKPPEDWRDANRDKPPVLSAEINLGDQTGIFLDGTNAAGFDDDDDGGLLGGFDLPPDTGFGEGGEVWAKDAALEPMLRASRSDEDCVAGDGAQDGIMVGDFDPSNPTSDAYAVSLNHREGNEHEKILSYFDNALKSQRAGWAGHEHWRIRKIKQAVASAENPAPVRQRKEKEPFELDFLEPMSQSTAEMVYTVASSNSAISLPKVQWKTKGRNLLPDDRHFNSRSLLSLFLKPKARLGRRNNVAGLPSRDGDRRSVGEDKERFEEMDEAYWARRKEEEDRNGEEARKEGDYDANFFADDDGGLPFVGGIPDDDDDDDDDEHDPAGFTDAREMLSPPPPSSTDVPAVAADSQVPQSQTEMLPGSFGSQLVTQGGRRLRPEYVNYARVAKKVDVRQLKENMWRGMSESLMASIDGTTSPADTNGPPTPAPTDPEGDIDMMDVDEPVPPTATVEKALDKVPELKFTDMIGDLRRVYPEQQMRDISTSYCFICLLHLANEKGLVLDGGRDEGGMQEIMVRRDVTVGEGYVGE